MPAIRIALIWFLSLFLIMHTSVEISNEKLNGKMESNLYSYSTRHNDRSQIEGSTSPTGTLMFNLPIVEHNVPVSTPIPNEIYPAPGAVIESTPGTPTPIPIPVQSGSDNLPIVIGALAIIIVILFAWFFVGYIPSRNKGEPA